MQRAQGSRRGASYEVHRDIYIKTVVVAGDCGSALQSLIIPAAAAAHTSTQFFFISIFMSKKKKK